MFTTEYAISAFRNILNQSVNALEREVSYAQSQLERMTEARMPRLNVSEYAAARGEFVSTIQEVATLIRAGQTAVRFLSFPQLSDYDQELADSVGEYDAEFKKMTIMYADIVDDVTAAYF